MLHVHTPQNSRPAEGRDMCPICCLSPAQSPTVTNECNARSHNKMLYRVSHPNHSFPKPWTSGSLYRSTARYDCYTQKPKNEDRASAIDCNSYIVSPEQDAHSRFFMMGNFFVTWQRIFHPWHNLQQNLPVACVESKDLRKELTSSPRCY